MADDAHTGADASNSPQASVGPDLSGHFLGILAVANDEAVHIGRMRLVERFVICHEGGQDQCCRGTAAVLIPFEQVGYIEVFETKELLDAETKTLGLVKKSDSKSRDSPEVR